MQYNQYQSSAYNELPKFEKIDYSQFTMINSEAQAFKGEVTSVREIVNQYGSSWGITMINKESKRMASFIINANVNSKLAQQLLFITTNGYYTQERIVQKNGTSVVYIDNIKGEVYVTLAYYGVNAKDNPVFKPLAFFYPDGRSIEEMSNPQLKPCENIKQSIWLAKKVTEEVMQATNGTVQQPMQQQAIQPTQQQRDLNVYAMPQMSPLPQNNEEDIPF